ncbi:hypothetical protein D1007_12354 [Hordeum vulgare]|nr:hypothetical protein D1007_12354 [Hordeum vulgare]
MVDARRMHAERRAARVVVTTTDRPRIRRHSAVVEAAATNAAAREHHVSSVHPSVQREGHNATTSSSHTHLERVNAQPPLLMVREILRYHPTDAGYGPWLARITQLVTTV